jgi:hypothetical protein
MTMMTTTATSAALSSRAAPTQPPEPKGHGLFGAAMDALDTVQNLPGFGLLYPAASMGAIGGPLGMIGAAAFSALTSAVRSAASTEETSAPSTDQTSAVPVATPTRTGDHVAGQGALATRTATALAAYDRTAGQHHPPGRILA